MLTHTSICFLVPSPPPKSTLFPYTTLFRSKFVPSLDVTPRPASAHSAPPVGRFPSTLAGGTNKGRSVETELTTDRKSTRLNSSHVAISYAVFCLKKKK